VALGDGVGRLAAPEECVATEGDDDAHGSALHA
jgi:hypothetical protein